MRAQGIVSAVAETAAGRRRIADQVAQTAGPAGDRASAGRRDSLGARGTQRKPLHSFRRDGGPPFEFRAGTRPELRIPGDAAQTRIISVARIRRDPRKSARAFKGIIFPDVSEFESYMPSYAVGLCRCGPCLPTSITGRRKTHGSSSSEAGALFL